MKDKAKREAGENKEAKRYGNEKPVSLHPLKPDEALRRAMSVPPAKKRGRPAGKQGGKAE